MEMKARADLVRAIRDERKQRARGVRGTPDYRAPRFGRETADQYVSDTDYGGDSSPAFASLRWDNQRNKLRGRARRGVRRASHIPGDGYIYGYNNGSRRSNPAGVIRPPADRQR